MSTREQRLLGSTLVTTTMITVLVFFANSTQVMWALRGFGVYVGFFVMIAWICVMTSSVMDDFLVLSQGEHLIRLVAVVVPAAALHLPFLSSWKSSFLLSWCEVQAAADPLVLGTERIGARH